FYAGGIGSVRGFENSTLGPKDENGDSMGGNKQLVLSSELLVPLPGADRTLRGLVFVDAGYVWGKGWDGRKYSETKFSLSDLRASWGVGVAWISPLGPLKFSLAFPIKKKKGDDMQKFQFQIGTGF
ncbi:MAG: BamA/TamA family outer membrane protein, partial [Duodenibacillus sp.]|nr:BamA/TamA family outer membrane protein [Duodenibacillus sp.]